jgi:transcription elongation factor B subunit 1
MSNQEKDGGTSGVSNNEKLGGCEGPDAPYVKLVSSDGHEFIIRKVNNTEIGKIMQYFSGACTHFKHNSGNVVRSRPICRK